MTRNKRWALTARELSSKLERVNAGQRLSLPTKPLWVPIKPSVSTVAVNMTHLEPPVRTTVGRVQVRYRSSRTLQVCPQAALENGHHMRAIVCYYLNQETINHLIARLFSLAFECVRHH